MPAPVLTALCLSTLALPVQSGARLIRRLDVAFESSKRTEDVYDARSRALAGVRSLDSAALVEALADAYATLEREADPIVARRQRLLLRGGGNSLVIQRSKLDPIHVLQDRILERLQGLESRAAHTRMLALMLRGKKPIPVLLRVRFAALVSRLGPAALTRSLADGEKTLEDALVLLRSDRPSRGRGRRSWWQAPSATDCRRTRAAHGHEPRQLGDLLARLARERGSGPGPERRAARAQEAS
ncbi:MAG: hypothetical protein ACE5F1_12160 [Planctomycetota bacterium]